MMSDSVMPPTPASTTCTWTSDCGQLRDLVLERLQRAGHVRLEHQVEVLQRAAAGIVEDRLQRALLARAARLRLALEAVPRSFASWRARRSFSTTRTYSPASGTLSKPSTSTGSEGVAARTLRPL
jgi:hypothetical protein